MTLSSKSRHFLKFAPIVLCQLLSYSMADHVIPTS